MSFFHKKREMYVTSGFSHDRTIASLLDSTELLDSIELLLGPGEDVF